ncbi:hypothetical protein EMCRGX_G029230 [Ephydatia muelleri]
MSTAPVSITAPVSAKKCCSCNGGNARLMPSSQPPTSVSQALVSSPPEPAPQTAPSTRPIPAAVETTAVKVFITTSHVVSIPSNFICSIALVAYAVAPIFQPTGLFLSYFSHLPHSTCFACFAYIFRTLSSALRAVVHENTEEAWRKLVMLPKCCLPASKRSGRHHKPLDLTILCDLWTRGQYDVLWHMATKRSTPTPPTAHGSGKSGKHIDSAISFAQKGLYSKACQRLVSSGIAPNSPDTWKLLQSKHPSSPIPSPPLVQPNPITLPASQHKSAGSGKVPQEVSKYMAGASVIALTKEKPNCAPDIRPIAAANFFQPFQYGVACPGGTEKIIHKGRQCVDNNWSDNNFALLKVDMTNAFNLVSRQTFLKECSKHFPELLPWSSWCYGRHPHYGTHWAYCFQSSAKADFVSIALQKLILSIHNDEFCTDLLLNVWYLDDGVLAGHPASVSRALDIIQSEGPSLGFHVNLKKSRGTPSSSMVEALKAYDLAVAICFTKCTGLDISVDAWKQAQLSPLVPSEVMGLHLNPCELNTAVKWWLGLNPHSEKNAIPHTCPLCPESMLDPLCHHSVTCKRGDDVTNRHNLLRNAIYEACRQASLSVRLEVGGGLVV